MRILSCLSRRLIIATQRDLISSGVCSFVGFWALPIRHSHLRTHMRYADSDMMMRNSLVSALERFLSVSGITYAGRLITVVSETCGHSAPVLCAPNCLGCSDFGELPQGGCIMFHVQLEQYASRRPPVENMRRFCRFNGRWCAMA